MCGCEHWKVVHSFVFVRSEPSVNADPLAVAREGSVFCVARRPTDDQRSSDGKWIRLGGAAKVWTELGSSSPDYVAVDRQEMFVLIEKADVGALLRSIPRQRLPSAEESDPIFERQFSPAGSSPAGRHTLDLVKLDHWVVLTSTCRIGASREDEAPDDLMLEEGDQLRTVDHAIARIFRDGDVRWLTVPPASQVYRNGESLLGPQGTLRSGYVKMESAEGPLLRRHTAVDTGVTITELASYGEPWVVEHDQVVVRRGPSTSERPMGIMIKGDVVGVRRRKGNWVELTQDSDVRFKKREGGGDPPIAAMNNLRRHKVSPTGTASSSTALVPESEAWMLVEHPNFGQLLRRARKRKGGLGHGCVLTEQRLMMYQQVIEVCHRRIYKENLDSLWDGEADKLPSQDSLEAKLFDEEMQVLHTTTEGKFSGGALVKEIIVRAKHLEGSSNLNLNVYYPGTSEEILGTTTVGYIDSLASEPRTGGGRAMWDFISGMNFICIACHSILLQKTVDFWQARGMQHMDPSSEKDCSAFRQLVMVHTMGKVVCELQDLQEALPKSKLPLFVWVPSRFSEVDSDLHANYVFRPDEGAQEIASP